jgi:hypothetical protein
MPNFTLKNNEVATIPIVVMLDGKKEAYPPGDSFSAASSAPDSLGSAIGADKDGNPALLLTSKVANSPGIKVAIADTSGAKVADLTVNIIPDPAPKIVLDVANATYAPQEVPAKPGP